MAELGHNETVRRDASQKALAAYETATATATALALSKTNPILLAVALNFSVFYYEILNDGDKACAVATRAIDDAMEELLASVEQRQSEQTAAVLHVLQSNCDLWQSEMAYSQISANGDDDIFDDATQSTTEQ